MGTVLPSALRVRVANASGESIAGVAVLFEVVSGSATVDPVTDTTAIGGFAQTEVGLGQTAGEIVIRATVEGPAEPVQFTLTALIPVTIEVSAGSGQSAPRSASLPTPLESLVRDQFAEPLARVTVTWELTDSAGPGALLGAPASVTDSAGVAANTLTLGSSTGLYQVTASVEGLADQFAVFSLTATNAPLITSVSPFPVREGFPATLLGLDFDPTAANNVVTFDGVAASVTSASNTQLEILVPETACLPARDSAAFRVAIGGIAGPPFFHAAIPRDSSVAALGSAEVDIRTQRSSVECLQFPARSTPESFLVVSAVATSASGITVPERFTRRQGTRSSFATTGTDVAASMPPARPDLAVLEGPARFDSRLRSFESALHRREAARARAAFASVAMRQVRAAPAAVEQVGDTISLNVIDGTSQDLCNTFNSIRAVVKAVGTRGIAVEDVDAPADGFTTTDYEQIVAEFDSDIYPTDTVYFGGPSDIDSNGKVFLVYTPEVNKITPPGSPSVVVGFFFAGDLFPTVSCSASNGGELFYLLVPDPTGRFSDPRSTAAVRQVTRGTVAHEFQHLINAAQRIFVTEGPPEDIWLNEGLSHIAEEVVGHAVTGLSPRSNLTFAEANADPAAYQAFYRANFGRLASYLQDANTLANQSPIDADADLETRGAIWSFLRWILDQEADAISITRSLVITDRTGVNNLESAVGKNFEVLLPQWLAALFADDFVAGVDSRFTIPSWNLRSIYAGDPTFGAYPLVPTPLEFTAGTTNFSVVSGSARYFLLNSTGDAPALSMRLTNQSGIPLDMATLQPQILLLRLP
ncbi:MAG: Ig-like domain-containing protein [Gemmatimonadota bacterium]|nr:MAG: Ig-like domain-containing protein [Gemmatimonadota bacterium]